MRRKGQRAILNPHIVGLLTPHSVACQGNMVSFMVVSW